MKKGKLKSKRVHKWQTQSAPDMNQRDYEDRGAWIKRRDKRK